jgi:pyruvate dehydrogenase (quinone)
VTAADVLIETLWTGVEVFLDFRRLNQRDYRVSAHPSREKHASFRCGMKAAAFTACGYAKFTGKLGVCLATSDPGGIHLLNGLYDAKLDNQPVLAITGLQFCSKRMVYNLGGSGSSLGTGSY